MTSTAPPADPPEHGRSRRSPKMARTPRIAFLHTGAVVIAPVADLARVHLGGATTINYLDDKIVADLGDADRAASVPERVADLVQAAQSAGADLVMLTCSSISHLAAPDRRARRHPGAAHRRGHGGRSRLDRIQDHGARDAQHDPHPDDRADPGARSARGCLSRDRQRGDRRGLRRRRGRRSCDPRPPRRRRDRASRGDCRRRRPRAGVDGQCGRCGCTSMCRS